MLCNSCLFFPFFALFSTVQQKVNEERTHEEWHVNFAATMFDCSISLDSGGVQF